MRTKLKERGRKLVQAISKAAMTTPSMRAERSVEPYVNLLLQGLEDKQDICDPSFFVGELRASFVPYALKIKEIKKQEGATREYESRFSILIDTLAKSVPNLPARIALNIARIADGHLGRTQYVADLSADLGWIFAKGSAFSRRGRILYSAVRFMRPMRCVEAGTFLGMSALYILSALARYSDKGCLHTVEISRTYHSVASGILEARFGKMVRCYCGCTQETLPRIGDEIGEVDFFFHDNGHSRDDYVRDFGLALEYMKGDGIVMFDDIYWKPARNVETDPRCYEGWLEVVSHPRVRRAVEIDSEMGLLLISGKGY
jgi:predicted O-methyltransferase YrrM